MPHGYWWRFASLEILQGFLQSLEGDAGLGRAGAFGIGINSHPPQHSILGREQRVSAADLPFAIGTRPADLVQARALRSAVPAGQFREGVADLATGVGECVFLG